MNNYEFSLIFNIPDEKWDIEEISNALYKSGCDDSTVFTGVRNTVLLEFFRESDSAHNALKSAENDILRAYPNAKIFEAKPDRVSMVDIAELTGKTRQSVRKLVNFLEPVAVTPKPFWHLYQVLNWYKEQKNVGFEDSVYETSKAAWMYNRAIDDRRIQEFTSNQDSVR